MNAPQFYYYRNDTLLELTGLKDEATDEYIDDASIDLKVDGKAITGKQRSGKAVTLTYTFDGIQFPLETHTASLTYKGTKGYTRTENWNFMNIKNVSDRDILWSVIIHMVFVISGIILAWTDKISGEAHGGGSGGNKGH